MFGAIYGDVIGSYYEVHCTKNYDFEFNKASSFTDDSVLIAAVCRAILNDPAEITRWQLRTRAREYAVQYRQYYSRHPHAGFGNMFAAWAQNPHAKNGHSYGNGASMRVIPIGYAYDTLEQTLLQAKASCLPTHNHREAIKGAQATAAAVFLARNGETKERIKAYLEKTFRYDLSTPLSVIRETHVFDSRTSYSVPLPSVRFWNPRTTKVPFERRFLWVGMRIHRPASPAESQKPITTRSPTISDVSALCGSTAI